MRNSLRFLGGVVLLAVSTGVPTHVHGLQALPPAEAQDPHHPNQATAAVQEAAPPEQRQGMMKMMSQMKAADAKLETLVQAMNAAKGLEKTDAIAAVVTALVEERRSMHSSMAAMMNMMGMMNQMSAPASATPAKQP